LSRLIKEGERVMKAAFKIFFFMLFVCNGLYGMEPESDFGKQCQNLSRGLVPHVKVLFPDPHAFKAWVDASKDLLNQVLRKGLKEFASQKDFANLVNLIQVFYDDLIDKKNPAGDAMLIAFFRAVDHDVLKQILGESKFAVYKNYVGFLTKKELKESVLVRADEQARRSRLEAARALEQVDAEQEQIRQRAAEQVERRRLEAAQALEKVNTDLARGLTKANILRVDQHRSPQRYFACNTGQEIADLKKIYMRDARYTIIEDNEHDFDRFISNLTSSEPDLINEYMIIGDEVLDTLLQNIQGMRATYQGMDGLEMSVKLATAAGRRFLKEKRLDDEKKVIPTIAKLVDPMIERLEEVFKRFEAEKTAEKTPEPKLTASGKPGRVRAAEPRAATVADALQNALEKLRERLKALADQLRA